MKSGRPLPLFRRLTGCLALAAMLAVSSGVTTAAAQDGALDAARELAAFLGEAVVICVGAGFVTVHPDGRVTRQDGGENAPQPAGAPMMCVHGIRSGREDGTAQA